MTNALKPLILTIAITAVPLNIANCAEALIDLAAVKQSVASTTIARGPEQSGPTRSAWGPALYRSTVSSVVLIITFVQDGDGTAKPASSGSGVLVSEGLVLTNWHVVQPHEYVAVVLHPGLGRSYTELSKEDVYLGRVVKLDQTKDLALVRVESKKGLGTRMLSTRPIPLEDPDRIEVGQDVFAIGHPEGLHWTYTEGIISQIRPRYTWEMEGVKFRATLIQTQAVLSYGSSGGPLINREGKIVGIISTAFGEKPGFNFAIGSQDLRSFLAQ